MFPDENQNQGFAQQQPIQQPTQQPEYQQAQDYGQQQQQYQQPVQQPDYQQQQQVDNQQYQQPDYQQAQEQPQVQQQQYQTDFEQSQQQFYQEQPYEFEQQFSQPQDQGYTQQPQPQVQGVGGQQPFQSAPAQQQTVSDISKMEREFDEWIEQQYPIPELPDITKLPEGDPNALKTFFDQYDAAQRERNRVEATREKVREAKDEYLWSEVESKYPNLARAPKVKQTLQRMYNGARQMGQNVTPLQITNEYVEQLNQSHQQGYQTSNVQRVIRRAQPMPNGGQRKAPPQPVVTSNDLESLNANSNDVVERAASVVAKMRAAGKGGFN